MLSMMGLEYLTPNTIMDPISDKYNCRYLYRDSVPIIADDIYLQTHCLNLSILKQVFPDRKIIKIKSDNYQSLKRRVLLYNISDPIESVDFAYSFIKWHTEYYDNTGIDWVADQLLDINTANIKFAQLMQLELSREYPAFDIALASWMEFGANAPIIDIAKSIYDK
jgi:hypothetical protein